MKLTKDKAAIGLLLALAACRKDGPNGSWVDPRLGEHLQIRLGEEARYSLAADAQPLEKLDKGVALWRGHNAELAVDSRDNIPRLKELLGRYAPVMVTFKPGSLLAQQLAEDNLTLAFNPGSKDVSGFALVAVPDDLVLEGLAVAAHVSNDHSCGNVQLLDLMPLVSVDALTPPVFDEHVKLDTATAMIARPQSSNIQASIQALENMGTRYHTTETGLTVATKIQEMLTAAGATKIAGATFTQVDHNTANAVITTNQKSLVLTIPGTSDKETTVVLGAHLDSINKEGRDAKAPGSDDDASGIATLIEIVRAIADTGATFKRTIEIHAYAAEEVGLVGSGQIASRYAAEGRKISAMFQLDMNSWSQSAGTKTIYLVENDTSPTLRRSLKDLLNVYLGGDYVEDRLAAGTSDHRSWSRAGYATVFPFENPQGYNEALHTTADTLSTINNLPLSARFAQLGLAFVAHHAGLVSAADTYDGAKATAKQALSNDLKVAVIRNSVEGYVDLSVSTVPTIKSVEVCVTAAPASTGCVKERIGSNVDTKDGARRFFAAKDYLKYTDDMRLSVFGYDEAGKLVAQRSVRLHKR